MGDGGIEWQKEFRQCLCQTGADKMVRGAKILAGCTISHAQSSSAPEGKPGLSWFHLMRNWETKSKR